jgi:hypothetical protein
VFECSSSSSSSGSSSFPLAKLFEKVPKIYYVIIFIWLIG